MRVSSYSTVAFMYDDVEKRSYEVALTVGALIVRELGSRSSGWSAVHSTLNPDAETYLARCDANFGWRIERVAARDAA